MPVVLFERDDAASPWLDFVGPVSVLALPMNMILFLIVPSVTFLACAVMQSRRSKSANAADGESNV